MEVSSWKTFLTSQNPWLVAATLSAVILPTFLLFFNQLMYMPWGKMLAGVLPPGDLGLPYFGNLFSFFPDIDPDDIVGARFKKYGGVSRFVLLGKPGVSVMDVENKKKVLMGEGVTFQSAWPPSVSMSLGTSSLLMMTGDDHKVTRALLSRWLTFDFLQRFLPRVEAAVLESVDECLQKGTVLFYDEARHLTFGIICNILLSVPAGPIREELSDLFVTFTNGMFSLLPINVPWTTFGKTMAARAKIIEILARLYKQRKAEVSAMSNPTDFQPRDVLDTFILYGEGDSATGGKVGGYSEEEVYDTILTMLFAGHETTSSVLTWLVYLLKSEPDTLKALREEHDAIAKTKAPGDGITWADFKSMKFTQKVMMETQRMRGTVGAVWRRTLADVKLGEYVVPKGWTVQVGFNHSAKCTDQYFKEPGRFDTNHFSRPPPPFAFTPFGAGIRICPGMELAKLEVCFFVHYFVTRCDWEGTDPKAGFKFKPILVPAQGYEVKVETRGGGVEA